MLFTERKITAIKNYSGKLIKKSSESKGFESKNKPLWNNFEDKKIFKRERSREYV